METFGKKWKDKIKLAQLNHESSPISHIILEPTHLVPKERNQ